MYAEPSAPSPVTVYWRPGCGFCAGLLRSLERSGLSFERRNIWDSEENAAFVRSVANGNETVPTVVIGDQALVNPTGDEVLTTVAAVAPELLPEGWEPRQPGLIGRIFGR